MWSRPGSNSDFLNECFYSRGVLTLVDCWLQKRYSSFWWLGSWVWLWESFLKVQPRVYLVLSTIQKPLKPWIYLLLFKLDPVGSVPCIWTRSYRASVSVAYQIVSRLRISLSPLKLWLWKRTLQWKLSMDVPEWSWWTEPFEDSSNGHRALVKINLFFKLLIFGEILLSQDYLLYPEMTQSLEFKSRVLL